MAAHWYLGAGTPALATVIVTAYNQAWVLDETLESVAAQTYRPIECVIVNDGSTDATPRILREFERKHGAQLSIKVISQPNKGAQAARNAGLVASTGEYIQFLDGDDLISRDKLQLQIAALSSESAQRHDVVYGDSRWLHSEANGAKLGSMVGVGPTKDILTKLLDLGSFNPIFSYLCRRSAVQECGPWNEAIKVHQDTEYILRMACCSATHGRSFGYVASMTGYYRAHQRQRTSAQRLSIRVHYVLSILQAIEAELVKRGLLSTERRRALGSGYRRVANWASLVDDVKWRESLSDAIRVDPTHVPERVLVRKLHRFLGVWRAEAVLRRLRRMRYRSVIRRERGQNHIS